MKHKEIIFIALLLVGICSVIIGLLDNDIFSPFLPNNVVLLNYDWLIIFGAIFVLINLTLLFITRKKSLQKQTKTHVIEILMVFILIATAAGLSGWLYAHYEKSVLISSERVERIDEQLKMWDQMERDNPFYCKKIVIRDDDIGDFLYYPSLEWISNLCIDKNIKITFSVIPVELVNNSEIVDYLNQLDRNYFEFATHGYEHIKFEGLPYEQQYLFIENGTKIIEQYLNYTPYTFVPPKGSGDLNTTKALRLLGYHSITDMLGYPSYVINFISDIAYDTLYEQPIKHITFNDLQTNFDEFYNSSDEYYIVFLHDWTFIDKDKNLDQTNISIFEQSIDYVREKNVLFMTIEEAYQWHIDESRIRTGKVNSYKYFIDLKTCSYNHTIKFTRPDNWGGKFRIVDLINEEEKIFNQNSIEFDAIKQHLYEITSI